MRISKIRHWLFAVPLAIALTAPGLTAQKLEYNPRTEAAVGGTVQEVKEETRQDWTGTVAVLSTPQGPLEVYLAPAEYLEQRQLTLSQGDQIVVTGSRVSFEGREVLLAREVRKGEQAVMLRDPQGSPQWDQQVQNGTEQRIPQQEQMRDGRPASRVYDPQTEATLSGTVQGVREYAAGPWSGTHVTLDTAEGLIEVRLGPTAFLRQQQLQVSQGDRIDVTGSKIEFEGHRILIARELRKDDRTVTLRGADGRPQWAGAMRPQEPMQPDADPGRLQPEPRTDTDRRARTIYDPAAEITVSGTVSDVTEYEAGPWSGTHITLFTDRALPVHLGPTAYLQQQQFQLHGGERLEVTGSLVEFDATEILLAREVRIGDRTITLRNRDGVSLWSEPQAGDDSRADEEEIRQNPAVPR